MAVYKNSQDHFDHLAYGQILISGQARVQVKTLGSSCTTTSSAVSRLQYISKLLHITCQTAEELASDTREVALLTAVSIRTGEH